MLTLYRLLLRTYPAEFRHEYGAEMCAAVATSWQAARLRGWRARLRMTQRVLFDWLISQPGAWGARPPRPSRKRRDSMTMMMTRELRLAARVLWQSRWSTAATILTLALAIGATTTVFSVVHAVLLRPLPYAQPDRLVRIWENNVTRNRPRNVVSAANFLEWRDRATSFASMAAFIPDTVSLTGDGPPEQLGLRFVSWNLFEVLGVTAAAGRTFRPMEGVTDYPRKVVLSWRLWQRRYNSDPSVIGTSLRLDGQPMEIVGVLPAGFRLLGEDADVYWQIREGAATRRPVGRGWQVIARLKAGVTLSTARADMTRITEQLEQQWPDFDTGWRATVLPVQDDLPGEARTPLLLLLAAVGIVLIAGCANTTNLLLARASAREREMALRSALGATRWHIVRQLLAEGVVLATLGAAAGLGVARLALAGLAQFGTTLGIPRLDESSLNTAVLEFSLALMAGVALVFSLVPALQTLRQNVSAPLAGGGRWSTGRRSEQRTRQALVIGQIACAVVLVIGGALVAQSLARLVAVDPGFNPQAFTFTVSMPGAKYSAPDAKPRFYQAVLDSMGRAPGVSAMGGVVSLPFRGMGTATSYSRPDQPSPARGTAPVTDVRAVVGDYFGSMQIPVIRGRTFSPGELASGTKVCVVSTATVRQVFGDEDPIGKFLSIDLDGGPDEIIGVVSDVHINDLQTAPRSMVYYAYSRIPFSGLMHFTVRSELDDRSLTAIATQTTAAIDKDIPVTDASRMATAIGGAIASPRAAVRVIGAFAGLALLLSLVGVAALLGALVANRIPEFGVRLALGATPSDVRRLVLAQGARLIIAGLVIGLTIAAAASSAMNALLFNVKALDPVIYVSVSLAIAALGLLTADIPARRATRANPAETLR